MRIGTRAVPKGLVWAVVLSLSAAGATLGQVIYDSTVNPQPGNLPSLGAEATASGELGDAMTFAGTARTAKTVTVTMSSWACQAGSLIATVTQNFAIPYRPSTDAINCTGGRWYLATTGACFNGLASNIAFDLTSLNLLLPNSVVLGVVYDTTSYGPNPIGTSAPCFSTAAGCPYDSLNIALAPAVTVGVKPFPDTLYWNDAYAGNYCDGGLDGTGTFRLDSASGACWAGYVPAFQVQAFTVATTRDGCKNNGWQLLSRADGSPFKNQGDCIQYVNTGK